MTIRADDVDTPDKFAEMCEEVKAGILEVLNATLVPEEITEGEKIPAVKNRRIIDKAPDTYASKLQSDRDVEGTGSKKVKKVHTFLVGYAGIDSKNPDNTVTRRGFRLRFTIDSYYQDFIGDDNDNAEKRHAAEVAKVCYALFQSRVLNRPGIVKTVDSWEERRGFARIGEMMVRESMGEVVVMLKSVPIPRPPL